MRGLLGGLHTTGGGQRHHHNNGSSAALVLTPSELDHQQNSTAHGIGSDLLLPSLSSVAAAAPGALILQQQLLAFRKKGELNPNINRGLKRQDTGGMVISDGGGMSTTMGLLEWSNKGTKSHALTVHTAPVSAPVDAIGGKALIIGTETMATTSLTHILSSTTSGGSARGKRRRPRGAGVIRRRSGVSSRSNRHSSTDSGGGDEGGTRSVGEVTGLSI